MTKKPEGFAQDFGRPPTQFKCGALLVRENEMSRKMFIIVSGKARVFKQYLDRKVALAILGEGEIFGELSFFDAEPRSASVEALTDLTAIVIDAKEATSQIAGLPRWVIPIFRTAFHRLREADQRITVLQSMHEYKKKSFKSDTVGKNIYLELLRFFKTLKILYLKGQPEPTTKPDRATISSEQLLKELEHMLGARTLSLRVFWKILKENDFIDNNIDETAGKVFLHLPDIEEFEQYLSKEVDSNRLLVLGHPALAIVRRIISFAKLDDTVLEADQDKPIHVTFDDIELERMPLHEEGIVELLKYKLLEQKEKTFIITPRHLYQLHVYQNIIKAFDHTMASLD